MDKKKKLLIGAGIAAILVIAIIVGVVSICNYHNTYVVIDKIECRRDSVSLDLSGKTITELDKIKELTKLEYLNLCDTGLTPEQYEDLQAALPDCVIAWSVPFQDGYCTSTLNTLTVDTLSVEDFAVFKYLPNLSHVRADNCRDYDALMALMEQYPELRVSYTVSLSGKDYYHNATALYITDPDADEVMEGLKYLPDVETVTLQGTLPATEKLIELKETYSDILFYWEFEIFGVSVNTQTDFINLNGVQMESTEELESYLPCFYNLTQVDMEKCGISNEDMAALNERWPDTKFVWSVSISGRTFRTDIKFFMPVKYSIKPLHSLYNLRYCTDIEVLDFGHYGVSDISFIEYMPNLRYLLILDCYITDMSVVANCTSLEFLELAQSPVVDFWPLTNLTNLKDLNLSATPYDLEEAKVGAFGDITPLYQMTWLDRLWMARTSLTRAQKNSLREALPDTIVTFDIGGCTTHGWRQSPGYFEHRDILGMWYMIH